MVAAADGELHRLPGWIAIYRAALAQARGDVVAAEASARRALELVLDGDHLGRGAAAGFLGLAAWTSGDLEAAHRSYVDCLANVQRAGYLSDALGCAVTLADSGSRRVGSATRCAPARRRWTLRRPRWRCLRGTADLHVAMAEIYRERNDLQAAAEHLLGAGAGRAHRAAAQPVSLARGHGGDPRSRRGSARCADLLNEAAGLHVRGLFPRCGRSRR